jgi:hypothetical protein
VQQLESIATARRRVEVRDTTVVEVPLDTLHLGVVVSPSRVRARIAVPRAPGGEGSGSARP